MKEAKERCLPLCSVVMKFRPSACCTPGAFQLPRKAGAMNSRNLSDREARAQTEETEEMSVIIRNKRLWWLRHVHRMTTEWPRPPKVPTFLKNANSPFSTSFSLFLLAQLSPFSFSSYFVLPLPLALEVGGKAEDTKNWKALRKLKRNEWEHQKTTI